jgi:hypothetical protein
VTEGEAWGRDEARDRDARAAFEGEKESACCARDTGWMRAVERGGVEADAHEMA